MLKKLYKEKELTGTEENKVNFLNMINLKSNGGILFLSISNEMLSCTSY